MLNGSHVVPLADVLNETWQYWRNPNYNYMRMMLSVVVAIIFSSSFIGAGKTVVALRLCWLVMNYLLRRFSLFVIFYPRVLPPEA